MFNSLSLTKQLLSRFLDAGLRDLVIEIQSGHRCVFTVLADAGEGEHQTSRDAVEFAVSLESNGLPVITSVNPVAHVVN